MRSSSESVFFSPLMREVGRDGCGAFGDEREERGERREDA